MYLPHLRRPEERSTGSGIADLVRDPGLRRATQERGPKTPDHLRHQDGVEVRQGRLYEKTRAHQHRPMTIDNRRLYRSATTPVGTSPSKAVISRTVPTRTSCSGSSAATSACQARLTVTIRLKANALSPSSSRSARYAGSRRVVYQLGYSGSSNGINWLATGRRRMICYDRDEPRPPPPGGVADAPRSVAVLRQAV